MHNDDICHMAMIDISSFVNLATARNSVEVCHKIMELGAHQYICVELMVHLSQLQEAIEDLQRYCDELKDDCDDLRRYVHGELQVRISTMHVEMNKRLSAMERRVSRVMRIEKIMEAKLQAKNSRELLGEWPVTFTAVSPEDLRKLAKGTRR